MIRSVLLLVLLVLPYLFIFSVEAKTVDPYKVLGVERSANQRDIQKAFHKLSLKYHPDKNKNKGAQEKFAEINNAYEILSDEDKRKNYDLYGDAQGNSGFDERKFGNHQGSTYFTSGGPGGEYFTSGPGGWQTTSGQGNARSFSFSFGGDSSAGGSPFGFDMGDIFSNFFRTSGNQNGNYHSGFSSSNARSNSESSSVNMQDIDLTWFNKKIRDQGMTWFLLFYTPSSKGYNTLESVISNVANSLHGALKAGKINCQTEQTLCRELGVSSARSDRLFIYGYGSNGKAYLLEYNGEFDARSLKSFCQDHLPRISKRVDLSRFEFTGNNENLPQVLLLTTKKETPVMWRAISGMYRKRFAFYDAEVHDLLHPFLNKFEIKALPALVGRLSNGDAYVLKEGIAVKDLQSGINELKSLLESFEKKNIIVSSQSKKTKSQAKNTPLLTASNMDTLCGDATPVCIIGIFRSQKAKEKLDNILSTVSIQLLTICLGRHL
ncbi:dnaJ protein ERDJ3A isoform X2 [Phalaenopsis equestris]|uniref:dnaJ protein ERDJ3A isoform X2 n=1 Tax=Phalaenopsis equestris TaxID=78828 RepID=UPI0009E5FDFB|nr:dnaJ protein ERDJ3A isoform X2 [Phalaenopsis equestris]